MPALFHSVAALVSFLLVSWFGLDHCMTPTLPNPLSVRQILSWVVFILAAIWWFTSFPFAGA